MKKRIDNVIILIIYITLLIVCCVMTRPVFSTYNDIITMKDEYNSNFYQKTW